MGLGKIWTVHQVLKPILGPSSSHTSAPLVAGYLTYRLSFLDEEFPSFSKKNIDEYLESLSISIICSDPKRERLSFIGHRTIRATILGLMGVYFDAEGLKKLDAYKKLLMNKYEREDDLLRHRNIGLTKGQFSGSYGLAIFTEYRKKNYQFSFNFHSLGGGVISIAGAILHKPGVGRGIENIRDFYKAPEFVPDGEELKKDIEDLFGSEVPIWVYFDTTTLRNFGRYHSFRDALEKGTNIYLNLDALAKNLARRYGDLTTNMFGEVIYRYETQVFEDSEKFMAFVRDLMWENNVRSVKYGQYSVYIHSEVKDFKFDGRDIPERLLSYTLRNQLLDSEMEVIVSAPTGGASGILPANLRVFAEENGFRKNSIEYLYAHYTAAAIGAFIANNMSVAGAQHGCLAEIGTSIAMATAAIIDLRLSGNAVSMEKRIEKIFSGVGIVMLALQGLACDPLFGYVEVPCVLRNALLSILPIHAANMVIGGYRPILSTRCILQAVKKTGEMLVKALKESGTGPLTCTYSLCKLREKGVEEEIIQLIEKKIDWAR